MRNSLMIPVLALLLFFGALPAYSQREPLDRIVVVVGDQVILASELNSQIQLYAFQSGKQPRTEAELVALQEQILDQMITEQLFLIEARQDTSISVRPAEVEQALDEHIARIASNFDSDEAFMNALAAEGIQRGHMSLHARSVALAAGVSHDRIDDVAAKLVRIGDFSASAARDIAATD